MSDTRGWWVISEDGPRAMLQRTADGEDPDLVIAEEYANCDHEPPEAPDDTP